MSREPLGRFHHVGLAVRDIDAAAEQFFSLFGAVAESDTVRDDNQRVRLRFIRLGDLRIELLEPAAEPSPLDALLKRGIGLYQVCYEVDDLEAELGRLKQAGVKIVSAPKPAPAFDNRRVAFVMGQGLLIELLEARKP